MNRLTAILLFAVVFVIGGIGGSTISADSNDRAEESGGTLGRFAANQIIASWKNFEQHLQRTQPALVQLQENLNEDLGAFIRSSPQGLPTFVTLNEEGVFIHFLKEVLATEKNPYRAIQYNSMFKKKEDGDTFIEAVKAYQERNDLLPPDGIIDPVGRTINKLEADIREKLSPSEPTGQPSINSRERFD